MKFKTIILSVFAVAILSSCGSYKKVTYLKGVESLTPQQLSEVKNLYTPKIMPGDILTIFVNSTNASVSIPFNLPLMPVPGNGIGGIYNTVGSQSYMVDESGNINFPVLGIIHVADLTRTEAENMIYKKICPKYIKENEGLIVTARYTNYNISVLGEVNRPGNYTFPTENVNILQALAQAGDLTIYGKRNNVLIKREHTDGINEFVRIDLQDKNLVLSPYFYLQQNDVIYVEPNKTKGNGASIGSTENMTIAIVSTLISVATLLITVFK